MGTLKLKRGVHLVRETWVSTFFRNKLRDPKIVTYFNRDTGQWVLATWLNKDQGLVTEIDDLGPNFEGMTREFVNSIGMYYTKEILAGIRAKMISQWYAKKRAEEDRAGVHKEQYDWMAKRTKDKVVAPLLYH